MTPDIHNWMISWHDERHDSVHRGRMFVTKADQSEIDERIKIMSEFITLVDVRADIVPDSEWGKILANPNAYIAPTHRIIP